jgi:hypothetical protein
MSERWKIPPSQYLQLDGWEAYCVDAAADYLLTSIESGLKPSYFTRMTQEEMDYKHRDSLNTRWERLKKEKECLEH